MICDRCNTNPRVTIALNSLTEILTTMSAQIIEPANLTLNIEDKGLKRSQASINSLIRQAEKP